MFRKKIGIYLLTIIILSISPNIINAASPSFEIYPGSGIIKDVDEGFTVDVLIDTGDYDVNQARFTISFDPDVVQLKSANRNNSLFYQWPDDESSIDNESGVVMLTGFTQSGASTLLNTSGDKEVMARLEFDIISQSEEDVVLDFEYGSEDILFTTFIMKDGSPPSNVLLSSPDSATFTYSGVAVPKTAIGPSQVGIALGLVLIAAGIFITSTKNNPLRKSKGTVVLYD